MNTFNRIIVILDILLTMTVLTLLLAFPVQGLGTIIESASTLLRLGARIMPAYVILLRTALIGLAILVDFMLVLLLMAELRGPRRKYVRVPGVSGGHVSVAIDSIASRLRYHIDPLPEVLTVKPRVGRKRDGVVLSLEVDATADINVPRKAEEILEITRQVVEEKMGLKLAGQPHIMIRTVTAPGGPPPRPIAAPAPDIKAIEPAFTPTSEPAASDRPAT